MTRFGPGEFGNTQEIRLDEEEALAASSANMPPGVDDDGGSGMVEKLRSEVKRIVVERLKEEAAELLQLKRAGAGSATSTESSATTESMPRTKGTFIIRMDEKGSIVTEAVETASDIRLESYDNPDEKAEATAAAAAAAAEEKRIRRAFITLLRMTVHLLLALEQDDPSNPERPSDSIIAEVEQHPPTDLSGLTEDVRLAVEKVFASNGVSLEKGLSRRSVNEVLSSFRLLWPENILPRRHFAHLEEILLSLARDDPVGEEGEADRNESSADKRGERLTQFMRSIRGEFASHLRQFYSSVADRSGLNGAHESKPNRTPDEL